MNQLIALCQQLPEANNPEKNFALMENSIKHCSFEKVQLIIFPEDFLYGVLRDGTELLNAARKFSYWIKRFKHLARKYKMDIIPGSFPCYETGAIFNCTVYINKFGKVLTHYSKTNLWLSERSEYSSNLYSPKIFTSRLGKTAIFICWDIFDHRLFESAIQQGVKWIIIPAFWSINQSIDHQEERGKVVNKYTGFNDSQMIDALIQSRVNEYNIGIIFCNFAETHYYIGKNGVVQNAISANRTQIAVPFNILNARITNRKEKILVIDVPDISQQIQDFEIYYGRRNDVQTNYPYLKS